MRTVVYVVQERESGEFLCPRDGDVGRTVRLLDAGRFGDFEEAAQAGKDHCDGEYDVVPLIFPGGA